MCCKIMNRSCVGRVVLTTVSIRLRYALGPHARFFEEVFNSKVQNLAKEMYTKAIERASLSLTPSPTVPLTR